MKVTLTQKELAILLEKNKLLNYLASAFTRTYFAIGDGKFVVFLRGAKGAAKLTLNIPDITEETQIFQVDYSKWLNALAKLSFSAEIDVALSEKSLKISVPGSTDTISLGIITYEASSSEADVLSNFIESNWTANRRLDVNDELLEAISIATSMLSPAAKNNAIALQYNSVLYADRSIVLEAKFTEDFTALKEGEVAEIHKYSAGFIMQAKKFSNVFYFSEDFSTICWKSDDGSLACVLVGEPCEIVIPSKDDINAIKPASEAGSFEIDHRELANALEFFSGFYEASVWKPITFDLTKKDGAKLRYSHPTTEIQKELPIQVERDGKFLLSSENLSKLLSQSIDRSGGKDVIVKFVYDDDAPGVSCKIGNYFDVVFAKLSA